LRKERAHLVSAAKKSPPISMRQMARYMRQYPLREFVTHRFGLMQVETAMQKSMTQESMKVVMDPSS
jgi:hypothetical protein